MFKETRRLLQKVFILGTLVACLGLVSAGVGTKASTENQNLIPCCSYCNDHPEAPICQHGCSDSCRASQ